MTIRRLNIAQQRHMHPHRHQPAVRIARLGHRDEHGEWRTTETETPIEAVTAPAGGRAGGRIRELTEAGVQLEAIRQFWTTSDLTPADENTAGDHIMWGGERWQIEGVDRWGDFLEATAVRREQQTEIPDPEPTPPLDLLARVIRASIAEATNLPSTVVIPGDDKAPRPAEPYASLLLIADTNRGGYPIHRTEPGTDRTLQQRTANFSLQFYRTGAHAHAQNYAMWVTSAAGLAHAETHDYRIDRPLTVDQTNLEISDVFDERARIELAVQYVAHREAVAAILEKVDGQISVDDKLGVF